jgi:hypothetical protein
MNKVKFRWLISISLVVELMAEVIYEGTFYTLPNELQDFVLKSEQLHENSSMNLGIIIASIVLFFYSIFVFVTMFKLKNNARFHAVSITCIGTVLYVFYDPEIKTGLVSVFNTVGNILWGIVLGSMYYSNLNVHFDRKIKKE